MVGGLEISNKNLDKRRIGILKINKSQAAYIRKHAKNSRITVTGAKKKSRNKKWYVDESREALYLLNEYEKEHAK